MRLADERTVFSVAPHRRHHQPHKSHQSPGRRLCPGVRPLSPARREVNYMLKLFVAIQSKLAEARSEEGQTMAEYGVVLAVITLVIVGTLLALSGAINDSFDRAIEVVQTAF